jgi:hypothetical protein
MPPYELSCIPVTHALYLREALARNDLLPAIVPPLHHGRSAQYGARWKLDTPLETGRVNRVLPQSPRPNLICVERRRFEG